MSAVTQDRREKQRSLADVLSSSIKMTEASPKSYYVLSPTFTHWTMSGVVDDQNRHRSPELAPISTDSIRHSVEYASVVFFRLNKHLIKKVFLMPTSNDLVYYVVLREDSIDNRGKFTDLIVATEEYCEYAKFNLVIRFLPERILEKSGLTNNINLD